MSEQTSDGGTGVVAIVALLILAALTVLFFAYGLPMLQRASSQTMPSTIKVEIPTPTIPTPTEPAAPAPAAQP